MRPHIICHMLSSIDGRINSSALKTVVGKGEYEATGALLEGDAWICGRTTMQMHFAEEAPFISRTNQPVAASSVYAARQEGPYAIAVDTLGKLQWAGNDIDGDHLICVLSEQAPTDYLEMLRAKHISYIVAGQSAVDLEEAVRLIGERFGVRTLLLEGGGHINGAFLEANLVDEVSLLLVPGIDGRAGVPTNFDGVNPLRESGVPLKLQSAEQREGGTLWLRYQVLQPENNL